MTLYSPPPARRRAGAFAMLLAAAVAGCSTPNKIATSVYQNEHFKADETYSRQFEADAPTTCEASRLALLSQGYVVTSATPELVIGNKRFQPDGDIHVQITFTVTCAPDPFEKESTTAFVNAVQDRYALKKASSSASVGLPVGSLSIPLSSSDDSLVKVGSMTIPAGSFYDRFFSLVQRYVRSRVCGGEERCAAMEAAEVEAAAASAAAH